MQLNSASHLAATRTLAGGRFNVFVQLLPPGEKSVSKVRSSQRARVAIYPACALFPAVADLIVARQLDAPPVMKASTGSSNDRTGTPGQTQSIICAGGWKNPPRQYHLKVKAICGAFLTVAAAVAGISYCPIFGALGFIPTGVLLISTILLFRLERPATFLGPQDGDHDIRNLYGQSGTDREKHSGERSDDNKVA